MLDLDALGDGQLERRPYRWAYVRDVFRSRALAVELARSVPDAHFTWSGGACARYRMANRTIVDRGELAGDALDDLSDAWRALVTQIRAPGYRAALTALTGCDLEGTKLQIRLCRYGAGCGFDPHTDRPDKVITHIMYLNERWDPEWGGELRILRSAGLDDVERRLPPVLDCAAVLVRSQTSWHAVAPVAEPAPERVSLLVHLTGRE